WLRYGPFVKGLRADSSDCSAMLTGRPMIEGQVAVGSYMEEADLEVRQNSCTTITSSGIRPLEEPYCRCE
ncbi:unnamed protein product, partial [Nezara viridula]